MINRHPKPSFFGILAGPLPLFAVAGILALAISAGAQSVQHLSRPFIGGMPGAPVVTGIEKGTNNVTVSWDGPSGYYQLYMRTNADTKWRPVGKPTATRRATINALYEDAFFRVSGPGPKYAGSQSCIECHRGTHTSVMNTAHAEAYTSPAFAASGGQNNASCLPCHTVGFGLPTGFKDISSTPKLAGVQCESCHGPAAVHAANPDDPIYRPRVEIAGTLCGGCHNDAHHPTYDEWAGSPHAVVTEDMNSERRISNCGRCHSGSVRMSMLKGDPLPQGDANVGLGCVVCHEPHKQTGNPAQLRYPLNSTKDYFLATGDNFAAKNDPTVNVCGQCHNHRGASWTSTDRAPHHSPQYNMLIGTVGEMLPGQPSNDQNSHGFIIQDQCVACHMQQKPFAGEEDPAYTGHGFKVESYEMCKECHPYPELVQEVFGTAVSDEIQRLKLALDRWATTKAPEALRTKYGVRAWEFTSPGSLSTGGSGPTTEEQKLIPEAIKKARFNLYLVLYDGSFGLHNPSHTAELLYAAESWVAEEIQKP